MTNEQITKEEDKIYDNVGGRYNYFRRTHTREFTDEERRELEVLFCRGMINSLLHFLGLGWREPTAKEFLNKDYNNKYLKPYVAELGEEKVLQLIIEQIESYKAEQRALQIASCKSAILKAFETLKNVGWQVVLTDGKAELTDGNKTIVVDMGDTAYSISEHLLNGTRSNNGKVFYDLIPCCPFDFDDKGEYCDLTA